MWNSYILCLLNVNLFIDLKYLASLFISFFVVMLPQDINP